MFEWLKDLAHVDIVQSFPLLLIYAQKQQCLF